MLSGYSPGQKNAHAGKVLLFDLPCRKHAEAVGRDEFVPDTDYRQPAGIFYPALQSSQRIRGRVRIWHYVITTSPFGTRGSRVHFSAVIAPVGQ